MNKTNNAIFLDRDGVINKERKDYVKTVSELEIFSDVTEPIKLLKDAGFLIVIITNQSAINRGLTNHNNVNEIHSTIQKHFERLGVHIDGFYYCPHRPDENCDCRKPKPGLILKAANEFGIDLKSSWLIGDCDSDIQAAELAGCSSIKIGDNLKITEAVEKILNSI